jgi:hypothetical protein
LRHLALVVGIFAGRLGQGRMTPGDLLTALEAWFLGWIRERPEAQRDTLPETDMAAMRAELDRQTEIASKAIDMRTEIESARASLGALHGIEAGAFSLDEFVSRTIDMIATQDRARTIRAEHDAARYRADNQTMARDLANALGELATERENAKSNAAGWGLSRQRMADAIAQAQDRVLEYERMINDLRAIFGKNKMSDEPAEYIDLVAEVRNLHGALGAARAVARTKEDALQRAHGGDVLVPLPKPAKVEPGQRWAFVMTSTDRGYIGDNEGRGAYSVFTDASGAAFSAYNEDLAAAIYLGPVKA